MRKTTENSRSIGKKGENIALRFLEKEGYSLLQRNYAKRCGEIDLIVQKNDCIAFVEVKYRRSNRLSTPEESVTPRKLKRMEETARNYIHENPETCRNRNFRFDLIAIEQKKETPPAITHYTNIHQL